MTMCAHSGEIDEAAIKTFVVGVVEATSKAMAEYAVALAACVRDAEYRPEARVNPAARRDACADRGIVRWQARAGQTVVSVASPGLSG
jgi:hypothetical protein